MIYYVMSIPEIITLMFILSLWMLSIFCCFKRYQKISTIERADLPTSYGKHHTLNGGGASGVTGSQSGAGCSGLETGSLISLNKNNAASLSVTNLNSNTNLKSLVDATAVAAPVAVASSSATTLNQTGHTVNLFHSHANPYPHPLIHHHHHLIPDANNGDASPSGSSKRVYRYEILTYEKTRYKHIKHRMSPRHGKVGNLNNSNASNTTTMTTVNNANSPGILEGELFEGMYNGKLDNQMMSNATTTDTKSNENFLKVYGNRVNGTEAGLLCKSNSEPAFNDLGSCELIRRTDNDDDTTYDYEAYDAYGRTKSIDRNNVNRRQMAQMANGTPQHRHTMTNEDDENLIDPKLIPKAIKKSLIDLHKKSIYNLTRHDEAAVAAAAAAAAAASSSSSGSKMSKTKMKFKMKANKSSPHTYATNSKTNSNVNLNSNSNLIKAKSFLLSSSSNASPSTTTSSANQTPAAARVYTQHKNKNLIRMKVPYNNV